MKLPKFDYVRPASIAEAIALLEADDGAKIISGGQSLLPILAFRLGAPSKLVDIGGLADLRRVDISAEGTRLGARLRWCDIEKNTALAEAQPLLAAMIAEVAHYQIRNRGTVGGSLAHADPAAEMPGLAVVADATIIAEGPAGRRHIPATEFFLGPLETALQPSEIVIEVHLPPWPAARRWAFQEFARRKGDFALAGVAVHYDPDEAGTARGIHVGVIGADTRPRRLHEVEALLEGRHIGAEAIAQAAETAAAEVEPMSDIHADAEYRRGLVAALLERVLRRAAGLPEE